MGFQNSAILSTRHDKILLDSLELKEPHLLQTNSFNSWNRKDLACNNLKEGCDEKKVKSEVQRSVVVTRILKRKQKFA